MLRTCPLLVNPTPDQASTFFAHAGGGTGTKGTEVDRNVEVEINLRCSISREGPAHCKKVDYRSENQRIDLSPTQEFVTTLWKENKIAVFPRCRIVTPLDFTLPIGGLGYSKRSTGADAK